VPLAPLERPVRGDELRAINIAQGSGCTGLERNHRPEVVVSLMMPNDADLLTLQTCGPGQLQALRRKLSQMSLPRRSLWMNF